MNEARCIILGFLIAVSGTAVGAEISFAGGGTNFTLTGTEPWESIVSASFAMNGSVEVRDRMGGVIWSSADYSMALKIDAAVVQDSTPNASRVGEGGRLFFGADSSHSRLYLPYNGEGCWNATLRLENNGLPNPLFNFSAYEVLEQFDPLRLTWNTQPNTSANTSTVVWHPPNVSNASQSWSWNASDPAFNITIPSTIRYGYFLENDVDQFGQKARVQPGNEFFASATQRPPCAAMSLSLGAQRFPLNINGSGEWNASGVLITNAEQVMAWATVTEKNITADYTLYDLVNNRGFSGQTGWWLKIPRGDYTVATRFAGLGCQGGNASLSVVGNHTYFGCAIIGSPPEPVSRPSSAGVGGGGSYVAQETPPPAASPALATAAPQSAVQRSSVVAPSNSPASAPTPTQEPPPNTSTTSEESGPTAGESSLPARAWAVQVAGVPAVALLVLGAIVGVLGTKGVRIWRERRKLP